MKKNIAAGVFVIVAGLILWSRMQEPKKTAMVPQKSVKETKPHKRRSRTGPRKPPASVHTPSKPEPAVALPEPAVASEPTAEARKSQQEDKLQAYFEALESFNDPTPAELVTLGELAFEANDPESAYQHYLEVIEEHPDDPMAPFALYKFAWAELNIGDVESAISDMALVVEWLETGEAENNEMLMRAAPEDLIFFQKK